MGPLLTINNQLYCHTNTGTYFDETDHMWKNAIGLNDLTDEEVAHLWFDCIRKYGYDHHAFVLFTGHMSKVWNVIRPLVEKMSDDTLKALKFYANNIIDVDIVSEIRKNND